MTSNSATKYHNQKVALLALSEIKGVGYWTLYKFVGNGGQLDELISLGVKEDLEKSLKIKIGVSPPNWKLFLGALVNKANLTLQNFKSNGIQILINGEPDFPKNLSDIPEPPQWIFVQGDLSLLSKPGIAIVGTRSPSVDGSLLTKECIALLGNVGLPTISGLAVGIDQFVHEESLAKRIPTIAVLGTGIANNYPSGSASLRRAIIEGGGAIVTEYLPRQSYSSENFIRRNRLQAALGSVLIPIEWNIKSGTAHTVAYAHNYGRKIINVYLPNTYQLRPELAFSEKKYSAVSIQISDQERFLDEIKNSVLAKKPELPMQASLDI